MGMDQFFGFIKMHEGLSPTGDEDLKDNWGIEGWNGPEYFMKDLAEFVCVCFRLSCDWFDNKMKEPDPNI